jgi:hypothetical protein
MESRSYPDDFLEPEEDIDQECGYCGYPCVDEFCSKECEKAYIADN